MFPFSPATHMARIFMYALDVGKQAGEADGGRVFHQSGPRGRETQDCTADRGARQNHPRPDGQKRDPAGQ